MATHLCKFCGSQVETERDADVHECLALDTVTTRIQVPVPGVVAFDAFGQPYIESLPTREWLYLRVASRDGRPVWVQLTCGHAGHSLDPWLRYIGQLISLALRHGATAAEAFRMASRHGDCDVSWIPKAGGSVRSPVDGIAHCWGLAQQKRLDTTTIIKHSDSEGSAGAGDDGNAGG